MCGLVLVSHNSGTCSAFVNIPEITARPKIKELFQEFLVISNVECSLHRPMELHLTPTTRIKSISIVECYILLVFESNISTAAILDVRAINLNVIMSSCTSWAREEKNFPYENTYPTIYTNHTGSTMAKIEAPTI